MLATTLISLSLGVRVLFAIARDKRFPIAPLFERVSTKGAPVFATLLVALLGLLTLIFAGDLAVLMAVPVVLLSFIYLVTVLNAGFRVHRLPLQGSFSLGRWRGTICTLSALWLVFEIGVLTIPDEFHPVAALSVGFLVASIVAYFLFVPRLKN